MRKAIEWPVLLTHAVRRKFDGPTGTLVPGDLIFASHWRNVRALEESGRIVRIGPDVLEEAQRNVRDTEAVLDRLKAEVSGLDVRREELRAEREEVAARIVDLQPAIDEHGRLRVKLHEMEQQEKALKARSGEIPRMMDELDLRRSAAGGLVERIQAAAEQLSSGASA